MATSPLVSNAEESPEVSFSPENPQTKTPDQNLADQQVPQEMKDLMVETITKYRSEWAPERLQRFPLYMKNVLMYRGQQTLAWDSGQNTYFDALAYWRSNPKQDGQDTYIERYQNNITQMLGDSFVGTMSRGIPPTIVQPQNAEELADVVTAQAGQEAISIIERLNRIHQMVRIENSLLYLYGVYFKHTRGVLDGEWAGWDEEDIFGDVAVQKAPYYQCFNCGTETPAAQLGNGLKVCPNCGNPLGPESWYEGGESNQQVLLGTKKTPKAMVRWDVYGPLEVDVAPYVQRLEHTPILSLDLDIDVGAARATFESVAEDIEEGAEVDTTPNASYEKLRRAEVSAQTANFSAETQNYSVTYSRNWMQPVSYWKLGNRAFATFMKKRFPDGCKVSLVGTKVVDVKGASLPREWSACKLRENVGMYPPSIADAVVPYNERFNDVMDLIDDWIERCSAGMTIYDKSRLDSREIQGRPLVPGALNGVTTKGMGQTIPLGESIVQFKFSIDPQVFQYPGLLLHFCELVSGVVPQSFGGGSDENIETAGGQKQALDTALTKFNIYWENEKEEHAQAAENALECLSKLMEAGAAGEIQDTIRSNGAQFRNRNVNLSKLQGKVKVYPDTDEGLPQSPGQIRDTITNIYEQAGKGNPIAMAILDVVPNQEKFLSVLAPPGTVIPKAAQRAKTQQDIQTLLQQDYVPSVDPQTGQMVQNLPVIPEWYEDFPTLRDTLRLYMQEQSDIAKSNPPGWARLKQFNDLAEQTEEGLAMQEEQRKMKVKMSGMPPPAAPDPTLQAAQQLLLKDAADEVTNLQQISHLPASATGGTISGQVSAGTAILKSALDAAKASAKK